MAAAIRLAENPLQPIPHRTPLERFKWANDHLAELGLDPHWRGQGEPDDPRWSPEVIAESIAFKYPDDDEGYPQGVVSPDAALLRALARGATAKPPEATLEDAWKFYIIEKVKGGDDETKKTQRIDRVVGHIRRAVGHDPVLSKLTRADAREVRDSMLRDASRRER